MHNILKDINRWRVLNTTKPKKWTNLAEASLVFYNLSEFRNLRYLNIFYLHTVCTMQFQHLNFSISGKDQLDVDYFEHFEFDCVCKFVIGLQVWN